MMGSAEEYAEVMQHDILKWENNNTDLFHCLMSIWQYIESFCYLFS